MKKIRNILFVVLIAIILSGCTTKSNVNVDIDGKATENVVVLADNNLFKSEKYTRREMIESIAQKYISILNFKKYDYNVVEYEKLSGLSSTKTYDSICSYFQDTVFNQYIYHHISCGENEYYYEIKNSTNYIPYCSNCSNWPALDDVELKITLPITAEEQNADEVDGNTYIWRYNKDTANKDFYLKINKVSLKENEEAYKQNLENKRRIRIGIIVATISIIILISIIVGRVLYKKYQSNKLDY